MSGNEFARKRLVVAVGMALAVMPLVSKANQAQVMFTFGEASLKGASGTLSALSRGAAVGTGDTIVTGANARVQLRFSDGSYVSLQPSTEFRIDQYQFNGKQDGSERGFFSLLKGGLRTITGLVGRSNKKNYQVSTGVATIGIRGTEYSISADGKVQGSVGDGEIQVCNTGGCLIVANGESYQVAVANTQALMTEKKVDLPAPPVQPGIATITVGGPGASAGGIGGEGNFAGGIVVPTLPISDSIIAGGTGGLPPSTGGLPPRTAPNPTVLTGTAQILAYDAFGSATLGGIDAAHSVPGLLLVGSFYDGSGGYASTDVAGLTAVMAGSTGIKWNHYLNATFSGSPKFAPNGVAGYNPTVHQITGDATPLSGMRTTGTYNYIAYGQTATSFTYGSNVILNGVSSVSLSVDFATATANLAISMSFVPALGGGASEYVGTGVITGNTLQFDTLMATSSACPTCWAGAASGFFAGANAEGVGLGYKVDWNGYRGVGVVGLAR